MTGIIALAAGFVALLGIGLLLHSYRRGMTAAYERIDALDTQVVETDCGSIEVLEVGEGEPVLVVHGIQGGVDQGIANVEQVVGEGYRRIFVSRFGYLGSPMPEQPTPERQADLYACLLDALGIERTAVIAHSAGSTSAIQFALRHPERVSRLVLVSPNAPGDVEMSLPPRPVMETLFRSDFTLWLITKYAPSSLYSMIGVPEGYELSAEEQARVNRVATSILPASRRANGALFDMFVGNPAIQEIPLEHIETPTLVVGAQDDPNALYENSADMAERIPNAELFTVEQGGHLMLGSGDTVGMAIRAFLAHPAAGR